MPQLTIRGIPSEVVSGVSAILVPRLATIISNFAGSSTQLSADDFTVDLLETKSFVNGHLVTTFPFIQVGWFKRSQAIQDAVAREIDRSFKSAGIPQLEIAFITFEKECYYADGEHY